MGHYRLGDIPKTQSWTNVVASVTGARRSGAGTGGLSGTSVAGIAEQTLDAAQAGLDRAIEDAGFRYTFFLLTQIVLAARASNWQEALRDLGIHLEDESGIFDFTAEVQDVIDDHVLRRGESTDVSEMAQQAAGAALAALAGSESRTLFGSGSAELQDAVRTLSTKTGFSRLGQHFFGNFMSRFLNFYLSRVTAGRVGGDRLRQVGELTRFNQSLDDHCHQSARIVRDFCGQWYSKTEFQQGISLENTSGFMAVALRKLRDELERQKEGA